MSLDDLLRRLLALTEPGAVPDPAVLDALEPTGPVPMLIEAGHLLAEIPQELLRGNGTTLRIAIAASFTTAGVEPLLRLLLTGAGVGTEFLMLPFNQVERQLADPASDLATFQPDVTLVLTHDQALLPDDWDAGSLPTQLERRLARFSRAITGFAARTPGSILLHTVPLARTHQRTMLSFADRAAVGKIWRAVNTGLLELSEQDGSIHVVDLEALLTDHPWPLRDERLYRYASSAWSPEVELLFAQEAATFCRAVVGLSRKVLVLDLDNTLWGGVVGDDGPEGIRLGPLYPGKAYVELQRTVRSLRRQGVLLAVASKNEAETVDRVLTEHPEMLLRPEDFVMRAVDWQPKDGNLRRIADSLGLGLSSFVFADDSRFECDLVRRSLPEVAVVHLDGDPAQHISTLLNRDLFAVRTTTKTDADRTTLYRARADRQVFAESFSSAAEYLHSLGLRVTVRRADAYTVPRLVQLAARTNQFTMDKNAHSEATTIAYASSPDHLLLAFDVEDTFGKEGIVGGIWISKQPEVWSIENFVMSCRVFSRGIEQAALHAVIARALADDVARLEATFRPTDRNRPAAGFYPTAGFSQSAPTRFTLPLQPEPELLPAWIDLSDEEHTAHV